MDMQKEREACELSMANGDQQRHIYLQDLFKFNEEMSDGKERYNDYQRGYWEGWQAAKSQSIPEGFVLVPKEKLSVFWQDDDEPENIVSDESDFDSLGDCIDFGDVMTIKKHTQVHIETETLYGTWGYKNVAGTLLKTKFFVGSHKECLAIVEAAQGEGE